MERNVSAVGKLNIFSENKFCRTSGFKYSGFRETRVFLFLILIDHLLELEGVCLDRREHIKFTCTPLMYSMHDFVEAVNFRLNKDHNYVIKNISSKRHA